MKPTRGLEGGRSVGFECADQVVQRRLSAEAESRLGLLKETPHLASERQAFEGTFDERVPLALRLVLPGAPADVRHGVYHHHRPPNEVGPNRRGQLSRLLFDQFEHLYELKPLLNRAAVGGEEADRATNILHVCLSIFVENSTGMGAFVV